MSRDWIICLEFPFLLQLHLYHINKPTRELRHVVEKNFGSREKWDKVSIWHHCHYNFIETRFLPLRQYQSWTPTTHKVWLHPCPCPFPCVFLFRVWGNKVIFVLWIPKQGAIFHLNRKRYFLSPLESSPSENRNCNERVETRQWKIITCTVKLGLLHHTFVWSITSNVVEKAMDCHVAEL